MSVNFLEKKLSGPQWSPDFCCMTSPIRVSEALVARESSACGAGCWRGTAAARRRFAFWKASGGDAVHSNVCPPPPQRSVKEGRKQVKIHHAEKTLQLSDVLKGAGKVQFRRGCSCRRNCVTKNFQRGHCKNTFFKIDGETIGGQGIEKSFQMVEVCSPVQRTHTRVVHVCKHTF